LDTVLKLEKLSKHYGRIKAVNEVSFAVPKGSVFGILGPNGSGKTTTLGMILGVIQPLSGSFSWFNNLSPQEAKKHIGALLETPNFYPYMTARQNLTLAAKVKQIKEPNIEEVLEQVKLLDRADDKFKTYSLGMKQRLAIASALLGNPEVLVLDEPTNGLDPRGIAEVRQLIMDIAARGITVLMASHILAEVEKVCEHVVVLQNGVLRFEGLASELSGDAALLRIKANDDSQLEALLSQHPQIQNIHRDGHFFDLEIDPELKAEELNQWLAERQVFLNHLEIKQAGLEEGFLKLIDS